MKCYDIQSILSIVCLKTLPASQVKPEKKKAVKCCGKIYLYNLNICKCTQRTSKSNKKEKKKKTEKCSTLPHLYILCWSMSQGTDVNKVFYPSVAAWTKIRIWQRWRQRWFLSFCGYCAVVVCHAIVAVRCCFFQSVCLPLDWCSFHSILVAVVVSTVCVRRRLLVPPYASTSVACYRFYSNKRNTQKTFSVENFVKRKNDFFFFSLYRFVFNCVSTQNTLFLAPFSHS